MKYYVLYNPYACNGRSFHQTRNIHPFLKAPTELIDVTKIEDYPAFFDALCPDDIVVLSGGDGTLNRFVNNIEDVKTDVSIFYYATGSGNDFLRDLDKTKGCPPFCINKYIKDLPVVEINGKRRRFLNDIGFGIDGYCCEVADRIRSTSEKRISYTSIALKGVFYDYHPVNAKITVDGETHQFERVWFAPTMNGRFFGGGMMSAPAQNRLNPEGTVSLVMLHNCSRFKILRVFPKVYSGKHVAHTEMITIFQGHEITVEFDRPNALQIDGETVLNVTTYKSFSRGYVQKHPDILKGARLSHP